MIQLVIKSVNVNASISPRLQGPHFLIRRLAIRSETTKEPHHPDLGLPVAVITGRIEDEWHPFSIRRCIARPEITVE